MTWVVSQLVSCESCKVRETTRLVGWRECKPGADYASQGMISNLQNLFGNEPSYAHLLSVASFIHFQSLRIQLGVLVRSWVAESMFHPNLFWCCYSSPAQYQQHTIKYRNWSQRRLKKTKIWLQHDIGERYICGHFRHPQVMTIGMWPGETPQPLFFGEFNSWSLSNEWIISRSSVFQVNQTSSDFGDMFFKNYPDFADLWIN